MKFSIYADDTSLIVAIDRETYDYTLKTELSKVMKWFSANDLLLNVAKTEYIFFGPHNPKVSEKGEYDLTDLHQNAPRYLFIDDEENFTDSGPSNKVVKIKGDFVLKELHEIAPAYLIEEHITSDDGSIILTSDNVKYLGLQIDTKLKFHKHIAIVGCKISRVIGIYWKCIDNLKLATKKLIYHSLVESYLNYGIIVWGSELVKNLTSSNDNKYSMDHIPLALKPIKKVQNKIIRAIFGKCKYNKKTKTNTQTSPLYKELGVLKFHDLYYYNLAIHVHNYFNNNTFPAAMIEKFETLIGEPRDSRNLGKNLIYKVPNLTSTYRKPSIAGSIYWNKLPMDLKKIRSIKKFKDKLKRHLINSY